MSYLTISFVILYLLLVVLSINTVLKNIRSQSRATSWIFAILFLPFGGIFFYYVFGKKKRRDRLTLGKSPFPNNREDLIVPKHLEAKEQLMIMMEQNNSSSLSDNNKVKIYQESQATFDALYACIKQAKATVHLQFYIVEDGIILDQLIELFSTISKKGVKIRFIIDRFGSFELSKKSKTELKKAKVELREFMPFPFFNRLKYLNNRNHRKLVIIDNKVAFSGGFNIMNSYLTPDPRFGLRKDTFVKVEGDAAVDLNKIFLADWRYCGGGDIKLALPEVQEIPSGTTPVHITSSSPVSRFESIMQAYFTIITDAEDYIYIVTPYFSPNSSIITALKTTALSGVKVELMLPYVSDSKWASYCMFSYIEELLTAQVKVYLYQNGFLHSKIVICDDIISSVGTANFDERSLNANFEVNALVYDKDIALQLKNRFIKDKTHCEELKLETFKNRAGRSKLLESLARLSSPLL